MRPPSSPACRLPGASLRLAVGAAFCLWLSAWGTPAARAHSCVWKVTAPDGRTLYLAGSVHALRREDFPLPASYDQAFAASAGLAFETDLGTPPEKWSAALEQAGRLPDGVTLRDRVDPRTYAYILKVASQVKGAAEPERQIEHLRPWALAFLLTPQGFEGVSGARGVESYLAAKARAAHKPTVGLVPFKQHIAVFGEMSDADSEVFLLHEFIHLDAGSAEFGRTVAAWRRGDVEAVVKDYEDSPSVRRRLLTERNLAWMPRIAGFLHSGKTWMVVAGAAHMAGPQGLPALLQARGYRVEQL